MDLREFTPVGHIRTLNKWGERRRILLETCRVYDRLDELKIGAKNNTVSLAVFKPTKVYGIICESEEPEWDPERLNKMRDLHSQLGMFEDNNWRRTFELIPKLPYSFSYRFEDADGRRSELQILDWEIGALYWNCLSSSKGDETDAIAKVRHKYFDEFLTTDLHFFLGTTQQFHQFAPNPWVIVGVFPIPYDLQARLL